MHQTQGSGSLKEGRLNDNFQVITEHDIDSLVFDPNYLIILRTKNKRIQIVPME